MGGTGQNSLNKEYNFRIPSEAAEFVKITSGASRIGQNFVTTRPDELRMGLVRIPSALDGIGQDSFGSRQDSPIFLMEQEKLVRIPSEHGWMEKNSFGGRCK